MMLAAHLGYEQATAFLMVEAIREQVFNLI